MTGFTTWERWKAGLAPRDRDERDRMREYDASYRKPSAPPSCPYAACPHNDPGPAGGAS